MANQAPFPLHNGVELHVDDFKPILAYYKKLGFDTQWMRQPEGYKGYLVVRLGHNVLCFWPGNKEVYKQSYFSQFPKGTKRGYGVELKIMVDDVQAYYKKVKGVANVVSPLKKQPWGLWDFRCVDPAGYYLCVTEKHNILDPKYAVE